MNISARRLLVTLTSLAPVVAFVGSAAARADVLGPSACSAAPLSQPFAPWGDFSAYALAPGGDFESNTWALTGGAKIIRGSEPFAATGSLGASALSVPDGASASSSPICLDAAHPALRLFVGGSGMASVSVVYRGLSHPVGTIHAGGSWQPSPIINTLGVLHGLLGGGTGIVSLRITGMVGHPIVDDVFIDPWQRT